MDGAEEDTEHGSQEDHGCLSGSSSRPREFLEKQKCLNLYRWKGQLTFILIWYTACQRLIDKFSSIWSGSYDLKRTVVCVRYGLCFLLMTRQEQTYFSCQWFTLQEELISEYVKTLTMFDTPTWQIHYFSNILV